MAGGDAGRDGDRHPGCGLMPWDRRGGHGTAATGEHITWSLAEGARGTRWRETATRDGALLRSVLLETTPAGTVARLEIATAEGLLTLHPASDAAAIHGNVVTPTGIRHLAFDWSPAHELVVIGAATADAVVARRLALTLPVGEHAEVEVLAIDDALRPRPERWRIDRLDPARWRFRALSARGAGRETVVAPDGSPPLDAAESWPLED